MAETVVTGSSPAGAATAYTIDVASDFVVTGGQPSWASATESWLNVSGDWGANRLAFSAGYIRAFDEVFVLADVTAMSADKSLVESAAVLSSVSNSITSQQVEVFGTADASAYVIAKALDESLILADATAMSANKFISESAAALSSVSFDAGSQQVEVFGIFDAISPASAIARTFDEAFNFAEVTGMSADKFLIESTAFSSSVFKNTDLTQVETLGVVETFGSVTAFVKAFDEALAFIEQVEKNPGLRKSESFSVLEQMKRNAAAVISDILIGTTDIDAAKFQSLLTQSQAVGYGPFLPFMEGEHEYKSALFKAAVTSGSVSSGRLIALKLNVDVPDVFDSGGVAVAATGTTVNFNSAFYSLPEVNVSIKGGVIFAAPIVSNITLTSFKVELRDATNALVAGNVSWAAQGY